MVLSLVCCQNFVGTGPKKFDPQIIMLDYYDGPTAGLMKCEICSRVYKFTMVDWDDRQEIRIHALAPISIDSFRRVKEIKAKHPPKWWPTGPEIDEIIAKAEDPTMVGAFSRWGDIVFAARPLNESDLRYVQEWLSLTDPTKEARDWFSFLDLSRDFGMTKTKRE